LNVKPFPHSLIALVLVLPLAGLLAAPAGAQERRVRGATPTTTAGGQFVFESGWVTSYGDLGDDFNSTALGAGAGDGLELGFRWRFPLSPTLSLGPSFHFINHRDLRGRNAAGQDYRVGASSYRYAMELRLGRVGSGARPRPFIAAGAGLTRNRFVGFSKDFSLPLDQSINALGLSLRAGAVWVGLEWSVVYNLNRFSTWRLFSVRENQDYNWDSFGVRVGWVLP
jgi:hypothetical protein